MLVFIRVVTCYLLVYPVHYDNPKHNLMIRVTHETIHAEVAPGALTELAQHQQLRQVVLPQLFYQSSEVLIEDILASNCGCLRTLLL